EGADCGGGFFLLEVGLGDAVQRMAQRNDPGKDAGNALAELCRGDHPSNVSDKHGEVMSAKMSRGPLGRHRLDERGETEAGYILGGNLSGSITNQTFPTFWPVTSP